MSDHFSEGAEKNRFETFIDAILAIIMTILVLEFKVPESPFVSNGDIKAYLFHLAPSLFSYLLSFATIISLWMDHHNLFRQVKKLDTRLILLNFLFILFLSAIPFTTSLAGRNFKSSFAVALVGFNYLLMNLSFSSIYMYVITKKLAQLITYKGISRKQENIIIVTGILLLIAGIPLAFVNTYISFSFFIVVILLHLYRIWHH
jgi:uncharacterized membrane protein